MGQRVGERNVVVVEILAPMVKSFISASFSASHGESNYNYPLLRGTSGHNIALSGLFCSVVHGEPFNREIVHASLVLLP